MRYQTWFVLTAVCALAFVVTPVAEVDAGSGLGSIVPLAEDYAATAAPGMPAVPDIVEQFESIDGRGGYPFTFRYWNHHIPAKDCAEPSSPPGGCFIGDDPEEQMHYQGVNRVQAPDGTAYLYLTRNGNPFGAGTDWPGEILIVEMGSRNRTGGLFEIGPTGTDYGIDQPREDDHTVRSITLDWRDDNPDPPDIDVAAGAVDAMENKAWKHPGSGQQVGDYLFVPLEAVCTDTRPFPADGRCGGNREGGAVLVLQVLANDDHPGATPADPVLVCQIDYYGSGEVKNAMPPIGGLMVSFDEESETYLFGYKGKVSESEVSDKGRYLTFHEVREAALCQGDKPSLGPVIDTWDGDGVEKWDLGWQMLNFVRDTGGDLFLLVTTKTGVPTISGSDWARLFQVHRNASITIEYRAEKQLYLGRGDDPSMGNLAAAGGVHVTPQGRLVIYAGDHDNEWDRFKYGEAPYEVCTGDPRCKSLGMSEFASGAAIPVANDDGPYSVTQGRTMTLSAPGVLDNDTAVAPSTNTAVKKTDPSHGSVTLNTDGSFTYTHNGDDATSDSFTYQARYTHQDQSGVDVNVLSVAATVTFTISDQALPNPDGHATGLVDPGSGKWYLHDNAGALATSFYYGNPSDYPFMGDWDGDGIETPGLYRQSDGYAYLRNSNSQGIADIKFFFGDPGDVPIAGDFNNDGFDTVSIYRPSNQTFYIINKLGSGDQGLGAADFSYVFGNPGDKPFVGDFDGDGVETAGLHRESTGFVYFRNSHTQGNADAQFFFGDPGDRLIAGDWNNDGKFSPALFRPSNTMMYFRYTNTQGNADAQFVPTPSGASWLPVSGTR